MLQRQQPQEATHFLQNPEELFAAEGLTARKRPDGGLCAAPSYGPQQPFDRIFEENRHGSPVGKFAPPEDQTYVFYLNAQERPTLPKTRAEFNMGLHPYICCVDAHNILPVDMLMNIPAHLRLPQHARSTGCSLLHCHTMASATATNTACTEAVVQLAPPFSRLRFTDNSTPSSAKYKSWLYGEAIRDWCLNNGQAGNSHPAHLSGELVQTGEAVCTYRYSHPYTHNTCIEAGSLSFLMSSLLTI